MNKNVSHSGAGIIPYAIYKNKLYFIGGKEVFGNKKIADFGGKKENSETPIQTASREAYEESMGIFGNIKDITHMIRNKQSKRIKLGSYTVFFVKVTYNQSYIDMFKKTYEYTLKFYQNSDSSMIPEGHLEMSMIKWFVETDFQNNPEQFRQRFLKLVLKFLKYDSVINIRESVDITKKNIQSKIIPAKTTKPKYPKKMVKKYRRKKS